MSILLLLLLSVCLLHIVQQSTKPCAQDNTCEKQWHESSRSFPQMHPVLDQTQNMEGMLSFPLGFLNGKFGRGKIDFLIDSLISTKIIELCCFSTQEELIFSGMEYFHDFSPLQSIKAEKFPFYLQVHIRKQFNACS